jgi:prepilin-type N-terminal cleavage/methylation domain-containing protein/prepilin-type processing-associated H-X9-DG protein
MTRRAFTLVELLAVIAVIGVLAGIIFSAIGSVRESAHRAECASNLRQIGTALLQFSNDHDRGCIRWIEEGNDYWFNVLAKGGYVPPNNASTVWRCPSNTVGILNPGETTPYSWGLQMTYAINAVWAASSYDHQNGPSYPSAAAAPPYVRTKLISLENPARTISVCDGKSWLIGNSSGAYKATAGNFHNGGMNAAFWDGHVEFFAKTLANNDPLFSVSK